MRAIPSQNRGHDGFQIDCLGRLGVDEKAMRYLGIEVERTKDSFILHNDTLIENLLKKAGLQNINHEDVPMRDIRLLAEDCPTDASLRLVISSGGGTALSAYCDSDWNNQPDAHLSTTGWVVFMGDSPISRCSRTQRCTARSVCESEYVAMSSLMQELVFLKMLAASLDRPTLQVPVYRF